MKEKLLIEFEKELRAGPMIGRHPVAGVTYTPQQAKKALDKAMKNLGL